MELHVLRVFVDGESRHGNPLGVVVDGPSVPPERRQSLAAELGYAETVFVDDRERGAIRIFTPSAELDFAGHPSVGTAWLIDASVLRPPGGEVAVRRDAELTWIAARPEWAPPFRHVELGSPDEVDAFEPPVSGLEAVWAWEGEGRVRSRVFPVDIGVQEDEATGSAAARLAALLGRELEIRQGRGSILHARPVADGFVEVGGRVVLDSVSSR